jgi:hypothetical protein
MPTEPPISSSVPDSVEHEGIDSGSEGPTDVRRLIREKIVAQSLPCRPCRAIWAGPGAGMPCAGCDRPILPTEIEFECEQPGGGLLRFHQACYLNWEEECQHLERATAIMH